MLVSRGFEGPWLGDLLTCGGVWESPGWEISFRVLRLEAGVPG